MQIITNGSIMRAKQISNLSSWYFFKRQYLFLSSLSKYIDILWPSQSFMSCKKDLQCQKTLYILNARMQIAMYAQQWNVIVVMIPRAQLIPGDISMCMSTLKTESIYKPSNQTEYITETSNQNQFRRSIEYRELIPPVKCHHHQREVCHAKYNNDDHYCH